MSANYRSKPILASHPAYNYLAKRYQWNIISLDLDPEEMPSEEAFANIKTLLRESPASHILWEAEPKKEIAARMSSQLNLTSVEFSPCELLEEEQLQAGVDYLTVMKRNIRNIRPVFAEDKGGSANQSANKEAEK